FGVVHAGPPLLRFALKERPMKREWESPTAQQLAASSSETPTGYCPVSWAWRSLLLLFACLRHGYGTRHTLAGSGVVGQDRDQSMRFHAIPQVDGWDIKNVRFVCLHVLFRSKQDNAIHQRRAPSATTLTGPPPAAMVTMCWAMVSASVVWRSHAWPSPF